MRVQIAVPTSFIVKIASRSATPARTGTTNVSPPTLRLTKRSERRGTVIAASSVGSRDDKAKFSAPRGARPVS